MDAGAHLTRTPAPVGAAEFSAWVRSVPAAWASGGPRVVLACLGLAGVVVDALSTSLVGRVPGLYEANQVAAAGQAAVGSVPLFMVLVSLPVAALITLVAAPSRGRATATVWASLVFLVLVKAGVAAWNTGLLIGMGVWLPGPGH